MKKMKYPSKSIFSSEFVFYIAVAVMALLVTAGALTAGIKLSLSNVSNVYSRTMEYMKRQCTAYADFLSSDEVKSLVRLTEQADDISYTLPTVPEHRTQEFLSEFADNQRLSAAVILDGELEVTGAVYKEGLGYDILKHEILSPAVRSVLENPKKIYSERVEIGDRIYDIAAVSRRDGDGVVFCCRYQNEISLQMSHSSVESLLAGYETVLNGTLYITDGEKIVASNRDTEHINTADVEEIALLEDLDENSGLHRFSTSDGVFYGGEERYQAYHIYAYFPADNVYATLRSIMLLTLAFLSLALLFTILLHYRSRYIHAHEISDQYNVIRAVSSIYTMNILIDLRHNRLKFLMPAKEFSNVDTSRPADDIFKHEFADYIGEKYRAEYMAFSDLSTLRRRLEGREFIEMEYRNFEGVWLSDTFIPKYNGNGGYDSVLLLTKNINEEKKLELEYQKKLEESVERERRANSAKTEFLRRMSHDVRTPINVILGMLEISDRNPEDIEGQKHWRSTAHAAADYLLELVNDVLTVNRMDDGEDAHNTEVFSLYGEIRKVCELSRPQAEKKDISLEFSCPEAGARLSGNALYLRQVIMNIIGNAVKFTQSGGRIVCSATEKADTDKKTADVCFVCTDNGRGMSSEFQKRMFEPFAQEENSDGSEYGGMGLGLALVKRLVDKMGGKITVESAPGCGTTFEVTIPFEIAADRDGDTADADGACADISGVRVLIAEDNRLNMEIAEYLLQDAGAVVLRAFNGKEAADIFLNSAPGEIDVILMDVMMPIMNGTEAARLIRSSSHADAKSVPILAMTADLFAKDSQEYSLAGFDGFIPKPIDAKTLINTVAQYAGNGRDRI